MAGLKGINRDQSQYITHNWCSHCDKWLESKPYRCPNCNRVCRTKRKFNMGKHCLEGIIRY
jgi:tRNA(Ile2) C34 agmatinyltransferase TiaS